MDKEKINSIISDIMNHLSSILLGYKPNRHIESEEEFYRIYFDCLEYRVDELKKLLNGEKK